MQCLFLSVLMVKFVVNDGRSHWLNGVALLGVYALISIAFWDYPVFAAPFLCS